ncbi:hypothetical protein [Promicromonospora sp. NPDC023805]|uniref:hypothetical protein n=1 Tax=Promicromonospora sp. NPDC023805 TaxID=3154696 RepID=UPI0033FE350B
MNQHDDGRSQDHGWEDPAEADLLKQTFGAMAGGVDPASPTGPAAAMSVMSKRVRRRRTAKLGGLGGGALALAGALVLGAGQLAPPDQAELLPGGSSSVQVSAPDFEVKDGYQPPWLAWSDLTCGMPVADLRSTAQGWSVAPTGAIYGRTADLGGEPTTSWGMAAALTPGQGELDVAPVLVWSQDGVVLDLGPDVFGAPGEQSEPLLGGGEGAIAAEGSSASTCSPTPTDIDPVYEAPLPEGDYEVQVVVFPEVASGRRATAVSEPVPVRIDADGAHSPGESQGESTAKFPAPAAGQVSQVELDRTTDWVTAEMTYRGHASDTNLRVHGQCAGGDPEALLPIELVVPSTGKMVGATQISCDGYESGSEVGPLAAAEGEAIDIRLPSVPDGVARLWVSLEPATPPDTDPSDDCSATHYEAHFNLDHFLWGDQAAAAGNIVLAAQECDSDALIALAKESEAELLSGTKTPEQVFALPEDDAKHYRTLVALLANTRGEVVGELPGGDATGDETVVWPRVATEEFADSDEAWQEVVDAGLLTEAEAEAQRADGYQGMRIAMTLAGTWLSYSAGD